MHSASKKGDRRAGLGGSDQGEVATVLQENEA